MKVLKTPPLTAQENMDYDRSLLYSLKEVTLHFYEWKKPSFTYGHFAKLQELLDLEQVHRLGLDSGRRITGGGVTFHFSDLAFALFIPKDHPLYLLNTLDRYRSINQALLKSYERATLLKGEYYEQKEAPLSKDCTLFCMANPTVFDVLQGGKKIGGAAQRKTDKGLLHHGTLSLFPPPMEILQAIVSDPFVIASMQRFSAHLFSLEDDFGKKEWMETLLIEELKALL